MRSSGLRSIGNAPTHYGLLAMRPDESLRQSTASQTSAVPSRLEERASWPSGEKATDVTSCVWPTSERISLPVLASQSFTVSSWLPVSTRDPSGENATEVTAAV